MTERERSVAPGADSANIRVLPPLIYIAAFGLGGLVDRFWPWLLVTTETAEIALRWAGVLLLAAGLGLDFWSVGLFQRSGTSPLPFRPATVIVARGPYRLTRNPMYLGMTLMLAAVGLLLLRGWIVLAAFLAALAIDRYAIRREERYLERAFGESYLAYKSSVRRWL